MIRSHRFHVAVVLHDVGVFEIDQRVAPMLIQTLLAERVAALVTREQDLLLPVVGHLAVGLVTLLRGDAPQCRLLRQTALWA